MHVTPLNPLPDDKILDWSKLKQIADDILKCAFQINKMAKMALDPSLDFLRLL